MNKLDIVQEKRDYELKYLERKKKLRNIFKKLEEETHSNTHYIHEAFIWGWKNLPMRDNTPTWEELDY